MLIQAENKNNKQKALYFVVNVETVKSYFEVVGKDYTRKKYNTLKKALKAYNKIVL